ncbi:hypothetical protein [Streptomyces sp. NPDC048565]|uniref:hypothetical protein n=1 Tax=Streptomyces sp. NPDC048565 TaxID=3155266 RepID=UPI003425C08A
MRAHDKEIDQAGGRPTRARPARHADTGAYGGLRALQRAAGNAAVARAISEDQQDAHGEQASAVRRDTPVHDALRPPRSPAHGGTHAPHVQRAEGDDLRGAKSPEQIVAALKKSGHSDDDAWDLMRHMTSQQFAAGEGQSEFNILDHIKDASSLRIPPVKKRMAEGLMSKRWTIRHYTGSDPSSPPGFSDIASTYDNAAAGKAGDHTNVADWRSLGNIKFTFYLVAVDGQVPARNWLNDTHWYAEWDLDSIPQCWVSPDLLEKMNKPMDADGARTTMQGVKAFRGSGSELKALLAASAFGSGNDPVTAVDNAIGGAFELKVPGGLPVTEWKKK